MTTGPADPMLARLIGGEIAATDPEVAARLEHDAEFARAVDEWRCSIRVLEKSGATERQLVAAAEAAVGDDDVALAREIVARELRASRPMIRDRRGPSSTMLLLVAAGALLGVILYGVTQFSSAERNGGTGMLDRPGDGDATPVGDVDRVEFFEIRTEVPLGARVRFRIYSSAPSDARPLFESGAQESRRWTPPPEVLAALPDAFRWTAEVEFQGQSTLYGPYSVR